MQAGKKEDRVELRTGDGKIWNVKLSGLTAIKDGKVGIVKVKKHGHYGSPHTRLLCFDFELQCLYWLKSDDKLQRVTYNESKNIEKMGKSLRSLGSIPSMDDDDGPSSPTSASKHHHTKPRSSRKNFIMLYNIIDIFRGKKTKILQRFSSRKAEEKACLSIICLQRNLDLQAPDEKTALELKEQLKDFYSQSMGFQLLSSHPQTSLRYDPQTYSALADLLHEKVLNFYKATEKRWIEYMETDAACKIVKDLPRLAKNIRIWEVRPSSFSPSDTREESGEKSPRLVLEPEGLKEYLHGNVRKTIQTGIGSSKSKMKHSIPCISMKSNNSLASSNPSFEGQKGNLRTTETKETQKGMVTQHGRVRVDMERKERWGRSIIEVMEALASRLCSDKKRADEIVKQLSLAVKQVEERGKDRQITLTRYFHSTFTKMVAMGAFLESMQQDDSDGDQDFNTAYHNPEILSVLKVCNQFVLVPAADLIKRECLGKRYRTRDYKPHGWYIDIEFHQDRIVVNQLKKDLSVCERFNFQYRLSFVFYKPISKLNSVRLTIDTINFVPSCPAEVKHEVQTRLMLIQRVDKMLQRQHQRPAAIHSQHLLETDSPRHELSLNSNSFTKPSYQPSNRSCKRTNAVKAVSGTI